MYKKEAVGWWTSPERDVKNQGYIAHWLYKNDPQLGWKPFFENDGFYVRCIKETYKTINFDLNDNLLLHFNSISMKYSSSTTFQEMLNMIYLFCLKGRVNPYSYGREWSIEIYDGERIEEIYRTENNGESLFENIFNCLYKEYRLIISRI